MKVKAIYFKSKLKKALLITIEKSSTYLLQQINQEKLGYSLTT